MMKFLKFHCPLTCLVFLAACGGDTNGAASGTSQRATAETQVPAGQVPLRSDITPLLAWCMETGSEDVCRCADTALREAASADDLEIYESMAPTYLLRRAAGDDLVMAFEAASAEAAGRLDMSDGELLPITNRIGNQHRAAINQCENR